MPCRRATLAIDTLAQAFLDNLGLEGFGIGGALPQGVPRIKGDGAHVF